MIIGIISQNNNGPAPEMEYILAAVNDTHLFVWQGGTWDLLGEVKIADMPEYLNAPGTVSSPKVSYDGKYVAYIDYGEGQYIGPYNLCLRKVEDLAGSLVKNTTYGFETSYIDAIDNQFRFSPDKRFIWMIVADTSGVYAQKLVILNVPDLTLYREVDTFGWSPKSSVAVSPRGDFVAVFVESYEGGVSEGLLVLSQDTGAQEQFIPLSGLGQGNLQFSSDGEVLFASYRGGLLFYRTQDWSEMPNPSGFTSSGVFDVAFNPNGSDLVVIGPPQWTTVIDRATWAVTGDPERKPVTFSKSEDYSPDGKYLAVGTYPLEGQFEEGIILYQTENWTVVNEPNVNMEGGWGRGVAFQPMSSSA